MQQQVFVDREDSMSEKFTINSSRLGLIEYEESEVIVMAVPILGFPDLTRFLLVSDDETLPFYWLQSLDDPAVAFVMIDVPTFFTDYSPNYSKTHLRQIGCDNLENVHQFGIVVVSNDPEKTTVNLKAPVIISLVTKKCAQIVLDDDRYEIKTSLFSIINNQ